MWLLSFDNKKEMSFFVQISADVCSLLSRITWLQEFDSDYLRSIYWCP